MYISLDGDLIGRKIESFILEENLSELRAFYLLVDSKMEAIKNSIQQHGGEIYLSGGDNILAFDPRYEQTLQFIHQINQDKTSITFSVGYASKVKLAYLALKYAKRSKDSKIIHLYTKDNEVIIDKQF